MDDAGGAAFELIAYGGALLTALACAFKSKHWFALLALVTGPTVGLIGAIRLGKPSSPWARRLYSREKMQRAIDRFPEDGEGVALDPAQRTGPPVTYWLGVLAVAIAAAISARHL